MKCKKWLPVQITGTNGTPIHHEGSLKNAERYRNTRNNSDYRYRLCFDNGSSDDGSSDDLITDGFPLSSLNEIEIRLGGVAVQRFSIDNLNIHIDNDIYNEENPMEYIMLQHINRRHLYGPIACVDGLIGPLLWWRGQGHAGGDILLKDLLKLVADENNDLTPQTIIIKELIFYEKDITGTMSLLQKMRDEIGWGCTWRTQSTKTTPRWDIWTIRSTR